MTAPQIADAGSASAYDKFSTRALELETSCGTSRTRVRFAVYTKRETKRKGKQVKQKYFPTPWHFVPCSDKQDRLTIKLTLCGRRKPVRGDDVTRRRCYECDRSASSAENDRTISPTKISGARLLGSRKLRRTDAHISAAASKRRDNSPARCSVGL